MKKQDLINLTLELYDLTGYFPNKEPLRYKIRGMGNDVLSDLLLLMSDLGPTQQKQEKIKSELTENIQVLENLFEVAKPQDWVSPDDIEEMKNEYTRIREAVELVDTSEEESKTKEPQPEFKGEEPEEEETEEQIVEDGKIAMDSISERQQRVVQEIEKNGPVQISDIKDDFSEVSRRTLIRDLNELTDQGLINKTGKGPSVFYSLNG